MKNESMFHVIFTLVCERVFNSVNMFLCFSVLYGQSPKDTDWAMNKPPSVSEIDSTADVR